MQATFDTGKAVSTKRPRFDPKTGRHVWREVDFFPRRIARERQPVGRSWEKTRQWLLSIVRPLIQFELTQSGARTVYIVGESETGVQWHGSFGGATSPTMASTLRPSIRRWRGPGPAMVIRDGFDSEVGTFGQFQNETLTIAIHEAVHLIEFYPKWALPKLPESNAEFRNFIATDPGTPADVPKWLGHGANFLRLAFHAQARVEQQTGINLSMSALVGFARCGYTNPEVYRACIADEITANKDTPLSILKAMPIRDQFMDKWREDTNRFQTPEATRC